MQSQAIGLRQLRHSLGDFPEVVSLVGLVVVFAFFAAAAGNFLTPLALSNILTFASITGIVVAGVAMLMIAGEFDLSVGSTFAVASYVMALSINAGVPPVAALALALLAGALLGLVNGLIVTGTGIPSFITTVGTMLAYRGIARGLGHGNFASFTGRTPGLFTALNGAIEPWNRLSTPAANFRLSIAWFVLIAALMAWVLMRTRFGNWVLAAGGNPGAALTQGVRVKAVKVLCFVLTGFLAGLASTMQFSYRLSVDPLRGDGMELVAVAACVIGGVRLTGGHGTIVGACLGVLLLETLSQGLVLMKVPVSIFQAVAGLILLVAVILNVFLSKQG